MSSDPITQNIAATTGAGTNIDPTANIVLITTCPVGGIINLPPPVNGKQLYIRNDVMTSPCTIKFSIASGTFIYNLPSTIDRTFNSNPIAWFCDKPPVFIATANVSIPSNFIFAKVTVDTSLPSYKVNLPPVLAGTEYEFISAATSSGTNSVTVASTSGAIVYGMIIAAGSPATVTAVTGVTNIVFSTAGGAGDKLVIRSDGIGWFITAYTRAAGGFTTS